MNESLDQGFLQDVFGIVFVPGDSTYRSQNLSGAAPAQFQESTLIASLCRRDQVLLSHTAMVILSCINITKHQVERIHRTTLQSSRPYRSFPADLLHRTACKENRWRPH